jgi:uncharacterized protein
MSDARHTREAGATAAPWYKQFWPWFLIALPASAVVASIASLVIAVRNADTLVREDWSDAGENINAELALEHEAATRGVSAVVRLEPATHRVSVALSGAGVADVPRLSLELRHPTDAKRDYSSLLDADGAGVFIGDAASARLTGSWYLTIAPLDRAWLLRKRVWLGADEPVRIAPSS